MATYYVVCITKHPTHDDPHTRIQKIGTSSTAGGTRSKIWDTADVITAIDKGDTFFCNDKKGDQVYLVVAEHNGYRYVKTVNDGIEQDNLLAQPDC